MTTGSSRDESSGGCFGARAWLGVVAAAVTCSACSTPYVAPPLVTIDARTLHAGDEPYDLRTLDLAIGGEGGPGAGEARRLRCVEVLSQSEWIVESDRGLERITVDGVRGADPRLPDDVNAYLAGRGLEQVRDRFEGADLLEWTEADRVRPSPLPSASGARIVMLAFGDGRPVSRWLVDRGWALPADTATDDLAAQELWIGETPVVPGLLLDGVTVPERGEGVRGTRGWQRVVASWRARVRELGPLTAMTLDHAGARLVRDAADSLGWTPGTAMAWHVGLDGSRPMYEEALRRAEKQSERARQEFERLRDQGEVGANARLVLPPSPPSFETYARATFAVSPPGPDIYVSTRVPWTAGSLHAVLAHELGHEIQEERLAASEEGMDQERVAAATEAHAHALALQMLCAGDVERARLDALPVFGPRELTRTVQLFRWVKRSRDMPDDDALLRWLLAVPARWSAFNKLAGGVIGPEEFLYLVTGTDRCGDLRFIDEGPHEDTTVVRIQNLGDETFRGQFSGRWMWGTDDDFADRSSSDPAFNLVLPAGASVRVRVRSTKWKADGLSIRFGAFSPTPAPIDEAARRDTVDA